MKSSTALYMLAGLAQAHRLKIYRMLVAHGSDGCIAGDIARKLRLPAPTLSFHLKALVQAGLISMRRDGRFIVYSTHIARMNQLIGFLTAHCCGATGRRMNICPPTRGHGTTVRSR